MFVSGSNDAADDVVICPKMIKSSHVERLCFTKGKFCVEPEL